jgi:HSP20 family protein
MYSSLMTSANALGEFGDLQRHFENLLGALRLPSSIRAVGRGAFPAINIGATSDAVELYALAPGIDPAKLEVSVDRGVLTLAGERLDDMPQEQENLSVYARERFSGPFKRVVSLPEDVDPTKVNATYRDGVLRVVLPKRESSKPRRVEVRAMN